MNTPIHRALVVNGDPAQARLITRSLRLGGWTVDTAANGQEAREVFARGAYEVLVCDVNLGEVDGIKMAGILRTITPSLRVVMVSGLPANIERAHAAGFTRSLGKPFALEDLKRAVGEPEG